MIAKVFEKQDFAGLERFGHGFRFRADAVRSKLYGDAQQLGKAFGNGFQRIFRNGFSLRTARWLARMTAA